MSESFLSVENLKTYYLQKNNIVKAVDGVSFKIKEGEFFALTGPSGCGKTTLGLSILKLIQPPAKIISGKIEFNGIDLLSVSDKELQKIRGSAISMVFQDPFTSLNPVMSIYEQLIEGPIYHFGLDEAEALTIVKKALKKVKISDVDVVLRQYPHQLSGGQRQRIMIAMALSCGAKFIIADEPTTALDVSTQKQIVELLLDLKRTDKISLLFISHNLRLAEKLCDKIALMSNGKIVQRLK